MKSPTRHLLLLLMLPALFIACSSDNDPVDPGQGTVGDTEFADVLSKAGTVEPQAEDDDTVSDTAEEIIGDYKYIYETHDVVDNLTSIAYLGMNDDIIWPGALVQGTEVHNFVYLPILADRAPVTLSVSLETSQTGGDITKVVQNPTLSSVRQGINDMLGTAIGENTYVPAEVEFNYQEVYSESHMSLYVGADVSYAGSTLSAAFDWSEDSTTHKIMAKYMQVYFTVDMDTPQTPRKVFAEDISLAALKTALPPNSCPMYVGSVSYGMMAFMCIESNFTASEMSLAIDYAYEGAASASVNSEYTAEDILRESSINIVVYGGSTAGLQDLETGFEGFMNVVEASSEFNASSPGVPLIYRFRNLADNSPAVTTFTSQYTLCTPINLHPRVRVTATEFYCQMADDEGLTNTLDMDRFRIRATAYNRNSEAEPGELIVENGQVYYWSTSGEYNMNEGDTWETTPPNSLDIVFDNQDFDFNISRLILNGWARDWDVNVIGQDSYDNGYGQLEIPGARLLENAGKHVFLIECSDFRIEARVEIEIVN